MTFQPNDKDSDSDLDEESLDLKTLIKTKRGSSNNSEKNPYTDESSSDEPDDIEVRRNKKAESLDEESLEPKTLTKKKKGLSDNSKKMLYTDESSSDEAEVTEGRRYKKAERRDRMEKEKKLGRQMVGEWTFKKEDEEILKKFRREVWRNSAKCQQVDGTESGQLRVILDKLEQGLKLTEKEARSRIGVQTIETYVGGLRKIMDKYNKRLHELFPGREDLRLNDFFDFNSSNQILPENPEAMIEDEKNPFYRCQMIQAHNWFLKLIDKELRCGTSFTKFLPRDKTNPDLPKQDFLIEEKKKAIEAKNLLSLEITVILNGSKDLLLKAKKKADNYTKSTKGEKELFMGIKVPDPKDVILKFLQSTYVK